MATLKKRLVFLSDRDWEEVRKVATETGMTMSAVMRRALDISENPTPRLRAKVLNEVRQAIRAAPPTYEILPLLDELETPA